MSKVSISHAWIRASNLIFGSFSVFYILLIFFVPNFEIDFLLVFISLAMLYLSFMRIITGMMEQNVKMILTRLNFIVGAIMMILSVLSLLQTIFSIEQIIIFYLSGLFLAGSAKLGIAIVSKVYKQWYKSFFLILGLAGYSIVGIVFLLFDLDKTILVSLIAIGFLANIVQRLVYSLVGKDVYRVENRKEQTSQAEGIKVDAD